MKQIQLTQGKFALVDDEDYIWLSQWKWFAKKNRYTIYAVRNYGKAPNQRNIFMHRVIINAPKGFLVDHINLNGLDNRQNNLRLCTAAQNGRNQRITKNRGSSIYKGVSWEKRDKKWRANLVFNYKIKFLGYFANEASAALAYNVAAQKCFGEFARLNNV